MPYIPIVIHSTLHRNQQRFREIPRSEKFLILIFVVEERGLQSESPAESSCQGASWLAL